MLQRFSPRERNINIQAIIANAAQQNAQRQSEVTAIYNSQANQVTAANRLAQQATNTSAQFAQNTVNNSQRILQSNLEGIANVASVFRQNAILKREEENQRIRNQIEQEKLEADKEQQGKDNSFTERRVATGEKNAVTAKMNAETSKARLNEPTQFEQVISLLRPDLVPGDNAKREVPSIINPPQPSPVPTQAPIVDSGGTPPPQPGRVDDTVFGALQDKRTKLVEAEAELAAIKAEQSTLPQSARIFNAGQLSSASKEVALLSGEVENIESEIKELQGRSPSGQYLSDIVDGKPVYKSIDEESTDDQFQFKTDSRIAGEINSAQSLLNKLDLAEELLIEHGDEVIGLLPELKATAKQLSNIIPAADSFSFKDEDSLNAYNQFKDIMISLVGGRGKQLGFGRLSDKDVAIIDGSIVPVVKKLNRAFNTPENALSVIRAMRTTSKMQLSGNQFMRDFNLPLDKASLPTLLKMTEEGQIDLETAMGFAASIYGTNDSQELLQIAVKRGDRNLTPSQLELLNQGLQQAQTFNKSMTERRHATRR